MTLIRLAVPLGAPMQAQRIVVGDVDQYCQPIFENSCIDALIATSESVLYGLLDRCKFVKLVKHNGHIG
jgi:hypothetical protein